MCYPEANEPYERFFAAMSDFEQQLTNILIYDMPMREKYIKIHEDENSSHKLSIYCQRGTELLVKVIINNSADQEQYGKDAVTVYAEDPVILSKIQGLPCYATMQTAMAEVREIVHADQVAVKLLYGF